MPATYSTAHPPCSPTLSRVALLTRSLVALGLAVAVATPAAAAGVKETDSIPASKTVTHKNGAQQHQGGSLAMKTSDDGSGRYAGSAAAQQLAHEIAQRKDWDEAWVLHWIGQARRLPSVIRLIAPPPTGVAKNWATYRARFIEPTRIEAGVRFWQAQRETLARAEQTFGVPAWLIAGIIGVETLYGKHAGNFRVLDALTTLSLDFPASHPRAAERAAFFRGELEALLQLAREQDVAPDQWRGSYAGAMGLPQFMPGSWQKFALDFDGDGRVDLLASPADAIGSVANYMKQHGWQTGLPTHYPVAFDAGRLDLPTLLAPDIKPSFEPARMLALGVELGDDAVRNPGPLALIELLNGNPSQGGAAPSYVAGTENFYVVTRYNWSSYYALAVIELGQAVQAALPARAQAR